MKRWGQHTGPQEGQVWEHGGELWLIVEDVRYSWHDWKLDVYGLTTGTRITRRVRGVSSQYQWKQVT